MKINLNICFEDFCSQMDKTGWIIFHELFPIEFVEKMNKDLELAYKICRHIQIKNGVEKDTENTLHHLVGQGDTFLEFLSYLEPLNAYLEYYFKGKYILNSFGGAINKAYSKSYAHRIHRDIRTYSGRIPLLLNTLFMLDDFTTANGATFLMQGSQTLAEKPSEKEFQANCVQALGKAGSLVMFDSNIWHRGGENKTFKPRRSVTPMFCKPFIKQQYDYVKCLGPDNVVQLSEHQKQVLGYYSRVPETLDQWYQVPEKRMYRSNQG